MQMVKRILKSANSKCFAEYHFWTSLYKQTFRILKLDFAAFYSKFEEKMKNLELFHLHLSSYPLVSLRFSFRRFKHLFKTKVKIKLTPFLSVFLFVFLSFFLSIYLSYFLSFFFLFSFSFFSFILSLSNCFLLSRIIRNWFFFAVSIFS